MNKLDFYKRYVCVNQEEYIEMQKYFIKLGYTRWTLTNEPIDYLDCFPITFNYNKYGKKFTGSLNVKDIKKQRTYKDFIKNVRLKKLNKIVNG